jgi:hypothetical protein
MGTPDNPEEFVQFQADALTIYVTRGLLKKVELGATQMPFYIDGYGRYALVFSKPWGGIEEGKA